MDTDSAILKRRKVIIAQRDESTFWQVIFCQNNNLRQHDVVIRFAGEAAAGVGRSLSELTFETGIKKS